MKKHLMLGLVAASLFGGSVYASIKVNAQFRIGEGAYSRDDMLKDNQYVTYTYNKDRKFDAIVVRDGDGVLIHVKVLRINEEGKDELLAHEMAKRAWQEPAEFLCQGITPIPISLTLTAFDMDAEGADAEQAETRAADTDSAEEDAKEAE